jgi:hypothetical protein
MPSVGATENCASKGKHLRCVRYSSRGVTWVTLALRNKAFTVACHTPATGIAGARHAFLSGLLKRQDHINLNEAAMYAPLQ